MVEWFIGCSGFHYNHWKGAFYPEELAKSKWFDFYNNRFKTLELNVTFYRFPRLPVLESWYRQSPPDFRFSVKVYKGITHYKQFIGTERMIHDFYALVREGLREKVGCILFQMPERMKYKPEKLDQILNQVDPDFENVLEFRNESWWNADVFSLLSMHNVAFCGMSYPGLPDEVIQNTDTVYYRFHGVPHLYRSKYKRSFLHNVADQVENNDGAKKAYMYFNNDIDASAITNAFQLAAYTKKLTGG